ncbi:MAG: hypothetical protein ABIL58_12375 [Pseudomonadota bacterium]
MSRYHFRQTSWYHGELDVEAFDRNTGKTFTLRWRIELDKYLASIYNGGPAAYERDIVGSIGMLTRGLKPVDAELMAEFKAWQDAEHEAFLELAAKKLEKHPDYEDIYGKYGPACTFCRTGYYDNGWHEVKLAEVAA